MYRCCSPLILPPGDIRRTQRRASIEEFWVHDCLAGLSCAHMPDLFDMVTVCRHRSRSKQQDTQVVCWRASLVSAAAVIPTPRMYILAVDVSKLLAGTTRVTPTFTRPRL